MPAGGFGAYGGSITAVLQLDAKQFQTQMAAAMKQAQADLAKFGSSMGGAAKNFEKGTNQMVNSQRKVQNEVSRTNNAIKQFGSGLGGGYGNFIGQMNNVHNAMNNIPTAANRASNAISAGMGRAGQAINTAGMAVNNLASSFVNFDIWMGALVGGALLQFTVGTAASVQQSQKLMEFTGMSATKVDEVTAATKKYAQASAYVNTPEMLGAWKFLRQTVGVTGDQMIKYQGTMGDTIALFKANERTAKDAGLAVEDALGSNQWRRFYELGIQKTDLLAAGWDGNTKNVEGFFTALKKVYHDRGIEGFAMQSNSVAAQWENIKEQLTNAGLAVGEALLPMVKRLLDAFQALFNFVGPSFTGWVITLTGLIFTIGLLFPAIKAIGTGFIDAGRAAVGAITTILQKMGLVAITPCKGKCVVDTVTTCSKQTTLPTSPTETPQGKGIIDTVKIAGTSLLTYALSRLGPGGLLNMGSRIGGIGLGTLGVIPGLMTAGTAIQSGLSYASGGRILSPEDLWKKRGKGLENLAGGFKLSDLWTNKATGPGALDFLLPKGPWKPSNLLPGQWGSYKGGGGKLPDVFAPVSGAGGKKGGFLNDIDPRNPSGIWRGTVIGDVATGKIKIPKWKFPDFGKIFEDLKSRFFKIFDILKLPDLSKIKIGDIPKMIGDKIKGVLNLPGDLTWEKVKGWVWAKILGFLGLPGGLSWEQVKHWVWAKILGYLGLPGGLSWSTLYNWVMSRVYGFLSWPVITAGGVLNEIGKRIREFRWPWGPAPSSIASSAISTVRSVASNLGRNPVISTIGRIAGAMTPKLPAWGPPAGPLQDFMGGLMAVRAGVNPFSIISAANKGFSKGGVSAFTNVADAMEGHVPNYRLYSGELYSDPQIWRNRFCNCMDGAELLLNENARYFGLSGSMPRGYWGGWPHRWAHIGGKDFDFTNKQKHGTWAAHNDSSRSLLRTFIESQPGIARDILHRALTFGEGASFDQTMESLGPNLRYIGYPGHAVDPLTALMGGGNCFDLTMGIMQLAQEKFGLPAKMKWGTYGGNSHVWANIGGRDYDLSRRALEGTYTPPPRGPAGGSPRGPGGIHLHFHEPVYGLADFEKTTEKMIDKIMDKTW